MAFEALNNFERLKSNFICILNDNDMSISPPVGAMAKYITSIRTLKIYDDVKDTLNILGNVVHRLRELSPLWEMHLDGIDLDKVEWKMH